MTATKSFLGDIFVHRDLVIYGRVNSYDLNKDIVTLDTNQQIYGKPINIETLTIMSNFKFVS